MVVLALFYVGIACHVSTFLAQETSITVQLDDLQAAQILVNQLPDTTWTITQVHYHADIMMDDTELKALCSINEGASITKDVLKSVLTNCAHKQKFETISFSFSGPPDATELTIGFTSFWTVRHVHIVGALLGKDKYRHAYTLLAGDRFNDKKHAHGLKQITDILHAEGFLSTQIHDKLQYHKDTKTIDITLHLSTGSQFTITNVIVDIIDATTNGQTRATLRKKIENQLATELKRKPYNKTLIDTAFNGLKQQLMRKGFLHAHINFEELIGEQRHRVIIQCAITLGKRTKYMFIGNHFFSNAQLHDVIFEQGATALLIPPTLLIEDIKKLYKKKGFFETDITVYETPELATFCIIEGNRSIISGVQFKGNAYFSQQELAALFDDCLKQHHIDYDQIRQKKDLVIDKYRRAGFWDAAYIEEIMHHEGDNQYVYAFTIEEGEQRLLQSIKIHDFEITDPDNPLIAYSNLTHPIPCSPLLIQEQRRWLTSYLHNHGYMYATAVSELINRDDELHLVWQIKGSKEQVRFGKTIITGSSNLPPTLITRELMYKEGDIYSNKQLEDSLKNLKSLGIFEHIALYPAQITTPQPEKTILIKYLEDQPFEIRSRTGFQLVGKDLSFHGATIKVGASILYKNPTNRADMISIDANYTKYERDARFKYSLPWLGPYHIKTDFKAYSIRFDEPIKRGSTQRLYRAIQDGFLWSFMHNTTHGQHTCNIGCEWMETTGLSINLAEKIRFEPRLIGKKVPYIFLEPTFFIDCLDNQVWPCCGSLSLLSFKGMFPLDLHRAFFIKILAEQSFFTPLIDPVILGIRLRAGHIFNQEFKKIMPPERFYLGGAYSLRGYQVDLVPPLGCYTDHCGVSHPVQIGGKSMANVNIELRFPLYKPLFGVVFTDLGALAQDTFADIRQHGIAGATGFGLRLQTPVGPLRFDLGWKWHKNYPQESRTAWFLTLGNAF